MISFVQFAKTVLLAFLEPSAGPHRAQSRGRGGMRFRPVRDLRAEDGARTIAEGHALHMNKYDIYIYIRYIMRYFNFVHVLYISICHCVYCIVVSCHFVSCHFITCFIISKYSDIFFTTHNIIISYKYV